MDLINKRQTGYSVCLFIKKNFPPLKNKKLERYILLLLEVFENLIKARLGITKQHARIFFKE